MHRRCWFWSSRALFGLVAATLLVACVGAVEEEELEDAQGTSEEAISVCPPFFCPRPLPTKVIDCKDRPECAECCPPRDLNCFGGSCCNPYLNTCEVKNPPTKPRPPANALPPTNALPKNTSAG